MNQDVASRFVDGMRQARTSMAEAKLRFAKRTLPLFAASAIAVLNCNSEEAVQPEIPQATDAELPVEQFEHQSENIETSMIEAENCMARGDFEAALQLYSVVLAKDPQNILAMQGTQRALTELASE